MGNFCGSAGEECVTELEGGFFHSVLCHSGGEHQKTLFIPKCVFGLLVLVKAALREQCIFPGDVWEAAFLLTEESVVPQDAGFVIANGRSHPDPVSLHTEGYISNPVEGTYKLPCSTFPLKFSLKMAMEGGFPPSSEFSISL